MLSKKNAIIFAVFNALYVGLLYIICVGQPIMWNTGAKIYYDAIILNLGCSLLFGTLLSYISKLPNTRWLYNACLVALGGMLVRVGADILENIFISHPESFGSWFYFMQNITFSVSISLATSVSLAVFFGINKMAFTPNASAPKWPKITLIIVTIMIALLYVLVFLIFNGSLRETYYYRRINLFAFLVLPTLVTYFSLSKRKPTSSL